MPSRRAGRGGRTGPWRRRVVSRQAAYFTLRGLAALGVVLSATVLPRGGPAALVCILSGCLAVLTCIGVNAGGPGEQSGSAPFERAYDKIRPPQGDWPPYATDRFVDGELVEDR